MPQANFLKAQYCSTCTIHVYKSGNCTSSHFSVYVISLIYICKSIILYTVCQLLAFLYFSPHVASSDRSDFQNIILINYQGFFPQAIQGYFQFLHLIIKRKDKVQRSCKSLLIHYIRKLLYLYWMFQTLLINLFCSHKRTFLYAQVSPTLT